VAASPVYSMPSRRVDFPVCSTNPVGAGRLMERRSMSRWARGDAPNATAAIPALKDLALANRLLAQLDRPTVPKDCLPADRFTSIHALLKSSQIRPVGIRRRSKVVQYCSRTNR
jgi:hypothetical protein